MDEYDVVMMRQWSVDGVQCNATVGREGAARADKDRVDSVRQQ